MEFSLEGFQRTSVKPFDWHPRKFFSFLMANSKGRFNIWVAPVALTFDRFFDWDFHISISATQGHTRVPEQVSEISRGERLSIERCRKLGMIFHATDNANYEGIRERGLVLEATRASWQKHRLAVHFVYAGGVTSPGPGTVVKYGPYVFYCNLDYENYLNHGHELYLTDNGVVLAYQSIAPMYLTFHYRPPHEKDPGGLRHEKEQNAAGVGSSHEEGTSATASASASGGSPQGEVPGSNMDPKPRPAPKKRPKTAQDASTDAGGSPPGEVPTLDAEALRKLIRENELREDRERRQAATHSEGSTRYAYQPGDTVHGRVDAHKSQQQEELNEVLRKARTNPWHLFAHGVLHRTDGSGQRMFSTFDDPLVKVTPWHTLSKEMRTLLGGEYNWASWMSHPLSGYSLHFFLKAFELGKLQGNYLVELSHKPRVYTGGYKSPYEKYSTRHPGGLPQMMDDISRAATMEFRPMIGEIGFPPPSPNDPRERKPKADDPDYSQKLLAHEAFNFERDVYNEVSHVRDDFSLLVTIVAESYGPDFFSYIQKNSQNEEIRRKYMVRTPEGYGLYDSTLRQPFNGAYILACADRVLREKEEKDFKSRFARKAKSDLRAYLDLKAKREAELEELYTRPYEDIAVEEFLEKLPSPQVEEILEPEKDTPMDASEVTAEAAHSPPGETADSTVETSDVPMKTEAPEGSPQGEVSGVKAERAEGSPLGEESETKDVHMDVTEEEVNDEMAGKASSPQEEEAMPDISPHTEDEGELHDQGIWGKCKTVADPEAYKATKDAEAQNEDAFENLEKSNDKKGLVDTDEYKEFIRDGYRLERKSPLVMLKDQRNSYNYTGFFHTGIRDIEVDPVGFFKVQHMSWRVAAPPHAHQKFHLSETALFTQVCKMLPIYDRRPGRYDYVFRSGDVRSTLDDRLMAKASDVQEAALEVQENLLRKVRELHESGRPATREELLNAMLHLFLSAGVDEDEVGDLSLDKVPTPQLFRYGVGEEGPVPIYTSKTKYTALILNLGNFVRGRKRSAPSSFSDYIEYDSSGDSKGALIKSIAQSKSHLFMLCEATNVTQGEKDFLYSRGWQTIQNNSGDIIIGSRTNLVGSSLTRLAGSTLVGEAHAHLPLTYMIVEIIYGKTLPLGGQGNRGEFRDRDYTRTLERAGTDRIRVCAFHLNSGVASKKISIAHECLASMFADCLHYQVDLIGGDANMALYRAMGSKQESMDIRGGMYQSLLDYLLEAYSESPSCPHLCCPRAQHVSANSLCLLKQYEDQLGGRCYKDCQKPDWNTFPGLDPMTATILEWGHSMTDDQWADFPASKNEFKIQVSEWLLNSTKESYLLGDQDLDSHTPLLLEVHANQFTGGRVKAMNRNPDTIQEAAARRKERQKMNKQRGSTSDPTADAPQGAGFPQGKGASGATSSGSRRSPEPERPPGGKTEGSKGGESSKGKESQKGKSKGKNKGKK